MESALKFLQPSDKPGSLGRLAHYEVLEVLGNGGFGTVVKAFDEKLHRFVAIKLMSPLLAATSAPRKRFVREARSAAAVRHENVIAIYAVEDQPIPYLVMEYIAGRTLQQKLDATGPLELTDVLRIGRQIAAGLAAAHAMGLIHRDIKPGNILLEDGVEHVKITDFGLARAADDASITQSGFIAGTPMYMAPEQAQGETIDQRADLFSLGSVLYTMCSGRPPFRAANTIAVLKRVVEDTPRPIREIIPEVPEWLCELISGLHAKNPADRITSARDVADLLARRLAELQGTGDIPAVPDVPRSGEVKGASGEGNPETPRADPMAEILQPPLGGRRGRAGDALRMPGLHGSDRRHRFPRHGHSPALSGGHAGRRSRRPRSQRQDRRVGHRHHGSGSQGNPPEPGNYMVEASKNGKLVQQELVTVTKNGRQVVRVSQEPPRPQTKAAPRSADESAWERVVAALSAAEQVKAVARSLEGAQSRLRRPCRAHHREWRRAGTGVQHG